MRNLCLLGMLLASGIFAVHAQTPSSNQEGKVETITATPEDAVELSPDVLTGLKMKGEMLGIQKGRTKSLALNSDLRQCGMQWHRDDGGYSVWRPSRPVFIIVTMVRGGKVVGSVNHTIRPPNQEISLLMNRDGQNWDGIHSCTVTI